MSYPITVPRTREIERCFKEYWDVPREVVVKEDLLNLGVGFTEAALLAAVGYRRKSYYLFSYNRASFQDLQQQSLRAPEEIRISGGPYDLRPSVISVRLATDSPYRIDCTAEGRLILREGNTELADVEYMQEPAWYDRSFPDGTKYGETVSSIGWGERTLSMVLRHCQMWDDQDQCLYCDLVANVQAIKSMGWPYTLRKRPEYVATVFDAIYHDGTTDEPLPTGIQLTGGSLIDHDAGHVDDTDFYLEYVRAIKDRVGNRWPLTLQTAALDEDSLRKLRDGGVDIHHANIEVWPQHLFEIICPGKTKFVGRDEWIRRVVKSVDIFGEGNVLPSMVAGVEMSQPYGYRTVEEAVASTTEGMDYLMERGVIPRLNHWCVEPLSALGDNTPAPLDYFIQIDRAWYELYIKHQLPPLRGYTMGPGRSTYHVSAVLDMGAIN